MATKMTREEAINKVRQMNLPKETMEILQALAPELAESEDERIRRWLCDYFSSIDKAWIHKDITCIDILRWLEKQKEQKPVDNPKWAELTWKDINELERIINNVHYEFQNGIGEDSFGELVLERFREYKDDDSMNEQKPAEWSEEDEKDMAHIIRILDDCYVYGTHDLSKTDHENLVNKLKSLRPSWKPNEEQMKALYDACCIAFEEERDFHPSLSRLYHDLRKL